jgi:Cys-rich repeat protein
MKDLSIGLVVTVGLASACASGTYTGSPTSNSSNESTASQPGPSAGGEETSAVSGSDAGTGETPNGPAANDASVETMENTEPTPGPDGEDASAPAETPTVEDDGGNGLPPLPPPCGGLCDEGQICNPATDECVECLSDSQCGEGEECRQNTCTEIISCASSDTCPAELGVCHSQLDRCVECEIDLDCPEQNSCVGRVCVAESSGCAMGADPCTSGRIVPMNGAQVLDGRGDEFCHIPGFELNFRNAARGNNELPHSMVMRVAWSTDAFHLYAEVEDSEVVTNPETEYLWSGDVVELFLAPQAPSELSGFFSGRVDGVQLLIAPPTATEPARAARLFWMPSQDNPANYVQVREAMTSGFAARATATGYAVEARLPWSMFGPRTPDIETGIGVAFDVGFSTANGQSISNPNDGREGAVVLYAGPTQGVNTCSGDQVPWCNSTTWCPVELGQRISDAGPSDAGN